MAYTGRLAHLNARLANIKLAFTTLLESPPGSLPEIDVPTSLVVDPHLTTLEVDGPTTSLLVQPRRTTVVAGVPTSLEVASYMTSLVVFGRSTSLIVQPRRTTLVVDG